MGAAAGDQAQTGLCLLASMIDGFSRLACTEAVDDVRTAIVIAFSVRARVFRGQRDLGALSLCAWPPAKGRPIVPLLRVTRPGTSRSVPAARLRCSSPHRCDEGVVG